jgi:hypothetical protein
MINLLPYNQKKIADRLVLLRIGIATVLGLVLLMVIGIILFVPTLLTINNRYTIATGQVEQFRASGAVVSPSEVSNLQDRTAVLVEKFAAPATLAPGDYIRLIQKTSISGISFTGFTLQPGEIPAMQVVGIAANREKLQAFVGALRKAQGVERVDNPLSNLVKSKNGDFVLTVQFAK